MQRTWKSIESLVGKGAHGDPRSREYVSSLGSFPKSETLRKREFRGENELEIATVCVGQAILGHDVDNAMLLTGHDLESLSPALAQNERSSAERKRESDARGAEKERKTKSCLARGDVRQARRWAWPSWAARPSVPNRTGNRPLCRASRGKQQRTSIPASWDAGMCAAAYSASIEQASSASTAFVASVMAHEQRTSA